MTASPEGGAPRFSVVVTTKDRPSQLAALLQCLTRLSCARTAFEVVVIDDGSAASLEPTVRPFADQLQMVFRRREKSGGPAVGRNTGAGMARGEYLAFTDDDCLPDRDWLTAFDAALRRLPTAMIGGHVRNGLPENVFSSSSQLIVDMVYGYYNRDPDDAHFFATNNMVLPAAGFRELGGFDEHFGFASEDRDFCARWRERGYAMVYEPTAVIEHMHALSLQSFCRQHFAYGRGAVEFHGRAARRGAGHFREHLGFHRSLPSRVRRVLKGKGLGQAMVIVSPLLLWQVANATGFFWERLAARRPR